MGGGTARKRQSQSQSQDASPDLSNFEPLGYTCSLGGFVEAVGLGKTLGRGKAGERPVLSVVSEEAVFSVVKGRALTTGALIAML